MLKLKLTIPVVVALVCIGALIAQDSDAQDASASEQNHVSSYEALVSHSGSRRVGPGRFETTRLSEILANMTLKGAESDRVVRNVCEAVPGSSKLLDCCFQVVPRNTRIYSVSECEKAADAKPGQEMLDARAISYRVKKASVEPVAFVVQPVSLKVKKLQ